MLINMAQNLPILAWVFLKQVLTGPLAMPVWEPICLAKQALIYRAFPAGIRHQCPRWRGKQVSVDFNVAAELAYLPRESNAGGYLPDSEGAANR